MLLSMFCPATEQRVTEKCLLGDFDAEAAAIAVTHMQHTSAMGRQMSAGCSCGVWRPADTE